MNDIFGVIRAKFSKNFIYIQTKTTEIISIITFDSIEKFQENMHIIIYIFNKS
jgi:hypothetical protein